MDLLNTPERSAAHQPAPGIYVLPIVQATTATFSDLYIRDTALFFIENGSKRVMHAGGSELIGETGDVMVFPSDAVVMIENRTWSGADYRAVGITFDKTLVAQIFEHAAPGRTTQPVQVVSPTPGETDHMLNTVRNTTTDATLPTPIVTHRFLELLVWIKAMGVNLTAPVDDSPLGQVRALLETDLTHPWRSKEVADHFAMSEATMRRWLAQTGDSFSKILINSRLERGLSLLQTTAASISEIALNCGFKTPSHFSDSFKMRFGIPPKSIRDAKS
ncbi:MAG: AraC family transcriptional regulator [Bacteroidota bacterium]